MNDKKQLYYHLTQKILDMLWEIKILIETDWMDLDDGIKWVEEE